uniref:Transposase n=1 Tax=Acrobeloides nanus TaxID=290746 RepID=A0A914D785_9BILA
MKELRSAILRIFWRLYGENREKFANTIENVPDFITVLEWPPYSPDLNPLDYSIWGYFESIACAKPHESVKSLKKAIKKAWDEMVKRVVNSWSGRLQTCVDAEGGYIE